MRYQRKVLIRNLVIAMVVADAGGIYYVHNRLSQPTPVAGAAIDDDAIAAAAEVHFKPQVTQPEAAPEAAAPVLAARDLPKPAFGQDKARPAAAPQLALAPVAAKPVAAKPVETSKPKAAAPALAAAPKAVAAPVAKPKVAPVLAVAPNAAPHSPVLAAMTAKKPVTLSVMPSGSAKSEVASAKLAKAEAPVRKRASFRKAFATLAKTAPVTATAGSLSPAAPLITAQFTPETHEPLPATMGITSQAMAIGQAGNAPETALPKELGAPVQPTTASTELPPTDEK